MNKLATTLPEPEPLGPGRDKAPSAPWLPWVAPSEPGGGSFISARNAGISPSSSDKASLTTALSSLASHPNFPRGALARGKGGGEREGKIRLVTCARFLFRLPSPFSIQSN